MLDWVEHVDVWIRRGRPVAFTAHVHRHFLTLEIALDLAWLEHEHGLAIFVRPPAESWQAPGQKILVEVWRREAAPREHAPLPEWPRPEPLRLTRVPRPRRAA
jgi:hypothetical protein